jgi:hypothetical protein
VPARHGGNARVGDAQILNGHAQMRLVNCGGRLPPASPRVLRPKDRQILLRSLASSMPGRPTAGGQIAPFASSCTTIAVMASKRLLHSPLMPPVTDEMSELPFVAASQSAAQRGRPASFMPCAGSGSG